MWMSHRDWKNAPVGLILFGILMGIGTTYASWRYWYFASAGTVGRAHVERTYVEEQHTRRGLTRDYYADVRYEPAGQPLREVRRVNARSPYFRQGFNYEIRYFPDRPDDIEFVKNIEESFPTQVVLAILSFTAIVVGCIWWQGSRQAASSADWASPPTTPSSPGDKPEYWEPPR